MRNAVDAARAPAGVPAEASLSAVSLPAFTIARPKGDLDIVSAPALRQRLLSVLSPGARLLIIDLTEVSFCDVAGLAMLAAGRLWLRQQPVDFTQPAGDLG